MNNLELNFMLLGFRAEKAFKVKGSAEERVVVGSVDACHEAAEVARRAIASGINPSVTCTPVWVLTNIEPNEHPDPR